MPAPEKKEKTKKSNDYDLYEDNLLTIPLTSINWGMVEPNQSLSFDFWAYNDGNSPVTLNMSVSNWVPINADDYLSISWSYLGETIGAGQKLGLTFTLSVSPDISGIDTFSFDIIITASG